MDKVVNIFDCSPSQMRATRVCKPGPHFSADERERAVEDAVRGSLLARTASPQVVGYAVALSLDAMRKGKSGAAAEAIGREHIRDAVCEARGPKGAA